MLSRPTCLPTAVRLKKIFEPGRISNPACRSSSREFWNSREDTCHFGSASRILAAGLQTGFELVKKSGLIRKFVKDIEEQSKVDLCRKVDCVRCGLVKGDNFR